MSYAYSIPSAELRRSLEHPDTGKHAALSIRGELDRRDLIRLVIRAVESEDFELATHLDERLRALGCRVRLMDRGWRRFPTRRRRGRRKKVM